MITAPDFSRIVELLGQQAQDDIEWANGCQSPRDADEFASETIFVICNSGMRFKVARKIFDKVIAALNAGDGASTVFHHVGKASAIDAIWADRARLFAEFNAAPDKLWYLGTLPWIGEITKYHIAKNFGMQVAKPDVHLQRLADREHSTVQQLCERLARVTGFGVPAVDTVLWRACATGVLNSRTGDINPSNQENRT